MTGVGSDVGTAGLGVYLGLGKGRSFGAGDSLWTPAELGTDVGLWLDAQDAGTVIEVAGRVAQWQDKSGNANHANQATASQRPVFDGAGVAAGVAFANSLAEPNLDHLVLTTDIPGREVFAVVSDVGFGFRADTLLEQFPNPVIGGDEVASSDFQYIFLSGDATGGDVYSVSLDGGSTSTTQGDAAINGYPYVPGDGTGTNIDVDPPGGYTPWPETTSPDIVTTKWETETAGNVLFRWVGALQAQPGVSPQPNFYANMRIRELIVIPNKLNTQAERDRMNGYLAWKWGIVDKLPAGHPYKLAAPTSEVWTPAELGGAYAFYDASDPATVTAVAGKVTQVLDKSGNGNHLTQTTGAAQPTYDDVNKTIVFDGVDDYLLCASAVASDWVVGNADCCLAHGGIAASGDVACRLGGVFDLAVATAGKSIAATSGLGSATDTNYTGRYFNGYTEATVTDTTDYFCGIHNYTTQHQDAEIRVNGADTVESESFPTNTMDFVADSSIAWGANGSSAPSLFQYDAEFMLAVKRQLTLDEQQKVEGWWAHTFDHVDKLPSTHPYKKSRPYKDLWTPIQLTDLSMWLDASRDDSITEAGGKVAQWDDLSYNGRHVSQATGALQPAYNAALKRVEYDAVDDKLRYIGSIVTQPFSCFTGDEIADNGVFAPLFDGYYDGITDERVSIDGFGANDVYRVTASLNACVSVNAPPNSSEGYYAEFNGASSALYINGSTTPEMTGDAGAQGLTNGVTLSNRSNDTISTAPGNAKTHILVFCDALLSSSDKAKIEGYWAHTFDYTSLLPADHPYKSTPPYI